MKKKFLPIMCSFVLCASMLAGCGVGKKQAKSGTEENNQTTADESGDLFADNTGTLTEKEMAELDAANEGTQEATQEAVDTETTEAELSDQELETIVLDMDSQEDGLVVEGEEANAPQGEVFQAEITIRDYGTIKLELDSSAAPISVDNFVKLASEGFYDGLTFHRIIDGFMIQGGDPLGNGTGGSDQTIKGEFAANGIENPISHKRGVISMARSNDMNSASSQFFIMHQDAAYLDGNYAAFGYVTEGMDVVDQICADANPIDGNGTIPKDEQPVIESIQIIVSE